MHFKGIRAISRSLQKNETSKSDIFKSSLTRIDETKHLNAFITVARKAGNNEVTNQKNHILTGTTFSLKDNYSSEGILTTCGSKMLANYKPTYNATVLNKLLNHGSQLIGKNNMDEFAMGSGSIESIYGPVKNPWSPDVLLNPSSKDWRVAGGSSGGGAVAVATGCCHFALGSDTGGSVRNPASYCGVVGLKPTYGLISRHGLIPLVNSMDCPSIFARSVEDAAIVLDTLKGRDIMDSTSIESKKLKICLNENYDISVKGLKVGIPKECLVHGMSQEVVDMWRWAADQFENAGAEVTLVSLPHMKYSIICYHILGNVEVASNMARFDGLKYGHRSSINESTYAMYAVSRREGFNDTVRSRILSGNYFLLKDNIEKYFYKAQKVRRLILKDYQKVFGAHNLYTSCDSDDSNSSGICDVLLAPTVISDAPLYSEFITEDNRTRSAEQDVLTQAANIAGVPAINIPTRLSRNNMPIGLQITGRHFSEPKILKAAAFLEKVAQFPNLEQHFTTQLDSSNASKPILQQMS
ncbi:glutamyl-tRNA(Gln) amidotransferase subunit A, mitochondrial-like [Styela clava]